MLIETKMKHFILLGKLARESELTGTISHNQNSGTINMFFEIKMFLLILFSSSEISITSPKLKKPCKFRLYENCKIVLNIEIKMHFHLHVSRTY